MRFIAFLLCISFATYLNAGIWSDLLAKLKKDTRAVTIVSVIGVRGANVSDREYSSLVKSSDLYWAE